MNCVPRLNLNCSSSKLSFLPFFSTNSNASSLPHTMTSTPNHLSHQSLHHPLFKPLTIFFHLPTNYTTQPIFLFSLFTFLHVLPQTITNPPSSLSTLPNTILLKIQRPSQPHQQQVKVHPLLITLSSFMAPSSSSSSSSPNTITKTRHTMPRITTILLHPHPPLTLQPRTPPTLSKP